MTLRFSRRRFIAALAQLPVALSAAYFGICARLAWAGTPAAPLQAGQIATLERLAWLLFPLPELGPEPHRRAAAGVAQAAAADNHQRRLIGNGIAELDRDGRFLDQAEADQLRRLQAIEQGEFFQFLLPAVRGRLWDDREVWALIGYEGSSMEFGGYLNRGLADIDWLPDRT